MLYVTTRNSVDAYTAHRGLTAPCGSDGGLFVPFRMPQYCQEELEGLKGASFNQTIANVLNSFFSLKLTGWDVDFAVGRTTVPLVAMSHRVVVAELWRNLGGSYAYFEENLIKLASEKAGAEASAAWLKIAIRIAVIVAVYGNLSRDDIIAAGDMIDVSAYNDDLLTVMACWYCRMMGLPIGMTICTCDKSVDLWPLIHQGNLNTAGLTKEQLNGIERLISAAYGCGEAVRFMQAADNSKTYTVSNQESVRLTDRVFCSVAGDDRAQMVINSLYRSNDYLADRYTALAFGGLQDYRSKTGESGLTLILSGGSALSSVDTVISATGLEPDAIKEHIK